MGGRSAGCGVSSVRRLGLDDLSVGRADLQRLGILFLICVACSMFIVDFARAPTDDLSVGEPAPRTVKAPFTFQYPDHMAYEAARTEAAAGALPVYLYQADLAGQLQQRVEGAWSAARGRLMELRPEPDKGPDLTQAERLAAERVFRPLHGAQRLRLIGRLLPEVERIHERDRLEERRELVEAVVALLYYSQKQVDLGRGEEAEVPLSGCGGAESRRGLSWRRLECGCQSE